MTCIAILLETPQGVRFLVAATPREAALKAESVIATIARTCLPVAWCQSNAPILTWPIA